MRYFSPKVVQKREAIITKPDENIRLKIALVSSRGCTKVSSLIRLNCAILTATLIISTNCFSNKIVTMAYFFAPLISDALVESRGKC